MKPSVEELRYQCRIDSDDDTEDVMLTLYLNASLKHAEKITNRHLYDSAVPDDDPDGLVIEDDIKLALMLLVSHWYENREPVNIGNITTTLPFGVKSILEQHRKIPGT
ncbi:head-tail connector protein [Klebsiella quasipneumoniae]|uniref:head-tail connector protein n=1 Tax=Klebsiella TaxID=570 RepID=UPI0029498573|nr:head-tail connector protein [Klebsiella quasipneumoniae]MDV5430801.1 head-tail connector protein [Klebsiella quasipneumoniae]